MSYAATKPLSYMDSETRIVSLLRWRWRGGGVQPTPPSSGIAQNTQRNQGPAPKGDLKQVTRDRTRFWINAGSSEDTEEQPTQRGLLGQPQLPVALKRPRRRTCGPDARPVGTLHVDSLALGCPGEGRVAVTEQQQARPRSPSSASSPLLSPWSRTNKKPRAVSRQSCPRASGHGHAILLRAPIVL